MRFSYHSEQWLMQPATRVFEFFANPANLPLLMPAWQGVRIEKSSIFPPPRDSSLSNSTKPVAGVGTRFTMSFRPLPFSPIRVRWEAEITEFSLNRHFCDEQVRGPFAYWKHNHSIRPVRWHDFDATLIADDIEYELPFGALGTLAHRLFVRRQIERAFKFRQDQLNVVLANVISQPPESQPDQVA